MLARRVLWIGTLFACAMLLPIIPILAAQPEPTASQTDVALRYTVRQVVTVHGFGTSTQTVPASSTSALDNLLGNIVSGAVTRQLAQISPIAADLGSNLLHAFSADRGETAARQVTSPIDFSKTTVSSAIYTQFPDAVRVDTTDNAGGDTTDITLSGQKIHIHLDNAKHTYFEKSYALSNSCTQNGPQLADGGTKQILGYVANRVTTTSHADGSCLNQPGVLSQDSASEFWMAVIDLDSGKQIPASYKTVDGKMTIGSAETVAGRHLANLVLAKAIAVVRKYERGGEHLTADYQILEDSTGISWGKQDRDSLLSIPSGYTVTAPQ